MEFMEYWAKLAGEAEESGCSLIFNNRKEYYLETRGLDGPKLLLQDIKTAG